MVYAPGGHDDLAKLRLSRRFHRKSAILLRHCSVSRAKLTRTKPHPLSSRTGCCGLSPIGTMHMTNSWISTLLIAAGVFSIVAVPRAEARKPFPHEIAAHGACMESCRGQSIPRKAKMCRWGCQVFLPGEPRTPQPR
jgi:hypothetical protein